MALNNYLKNVMKSVAYAAADVGAEHTPGIQEFTSTNKEFAVATYAILKNPKQTLRRSVSAIQESKIYKTLDYGIRNASEDLRTGNFYNKERKDRDELKLSGFDVSDMNDLSEFGIDDDWESSIGSSSKNTEITAGDMKIVESIEGSNAALANSTVNAIITSSNYEIKNSRVNTSMLYMQNERLLGGLHKDITVIGSTMQQMYNLQCSSLQNIDKNMSDFFTQESKLNVERNKILAELLELQRSAYKPASDKEKEALDKKKSTKTTWDDINSDGIINISEYVNAVKKNINSQLSTLIPGFGGDSNMFATYLASPLEEAVKYVVNGVIPATVKAATKELDSSISGIFSTIIARLGNARSKGDGLGGFLGKIFGINTSVDRSIDTSRYEKGPVPFDGITRKAIIDVIPTYLRRIEAVLSGRPEELYDYRNGKWTTFKNIKTTYDNIKKSSINRGTSDIIEAMNPGIQAVRKGISTKYQKDNFDKAIEEFRAYLYENNGYFNEKVSAEANNISASNYPKLNEFYEQIRTIYRDFDRIQHTDDKGNVTTRHTNLSRRLRLTNEILDAKQAENKQYRNAENEHGNILQSIFGIDHKSIDAHGKWDSKDKNKFEAFNILKSTKDKLGNTIFDYLQNINKELIWVRVNRLQNAIGLANNTNTVTNNNTTPTNNTTNNTTNNANISAYNNTATTSNTNNNTNNATAIANTIMGTTGNAGEITLGQIENYINKNGASSSSVSSSTNENASIEKAALEAISSGKAIDLRSFEVDQQAYLLRLSEMLSENAVDNYRQEIEGYNQNVISNYLDKHFIRANIRSQEDIEKAIEKADKEGKNTDEVMTTEEETFFKKIMKRLGMGESILGGVARASADVFTDLLYTADRAIYDMMFKTEIQDDEDKKTYKGFMDAMVGKMSDKFKDFGDWFKENIIEKLKKSLGIDDEFKERFKKFFLENGSRLWTSFKDANSSVYSPLLNQVTTALGMNEEGTELILQNRANSRQAIKEKIKRAKSATNLMDEDFISLLSDYGLNWADYNNTDEALSKLIPKLQDEYYKYTNHGIEIDLQDAEGMNYLFATLARDAAKRKEVQEAYGYKPKASDANSNAELRNIMYLHSKTSYSDLLKAVPGSMFFSEEMLNKFQFEGDVKEKQKLLDKYVRARGLSSKVDAYKYNTEDELSKAFIDAIILARNQHIPTANITNEQQNATTNIDNTTTSTNASGTMGKPFSGLTTLTKGEGLINNNGVGVVPKTGVYNITKPTHIINTEDMYDIGAIKGPRVTVGQALAKEKNAAKAAGFKIAHHDSGTMKIFNRGSDNITPEEFINQAKLNIPEAAAGGLLGTIILGLVGHPLIGGAAGAALSIIAGSDTLKEKLFGKIGTDGKRDDSGIISKTVTDTFNKHFPDMAKYGLAGIIPGLLTPLGPIGGLLVGGAFGYLKNNEKFTNKYFGEEGKLHIKSEEKKIIESMLPGALKGAGVGAVATLFGGPFGLLGNAALGSAIGMMVSTEDFKNLILGEEIDGERVGGIADAFKDAFKPFADSLEKAALKLTTAFDTHIINPLANLITPAIHALPKFLGTIPRLITDKITNVVTDSIHKTYKTIVNRTIGKAARGVGKLASGAASVASGLMWLPGKGMTIAGDALRSYNITHGDLMNMSQADAVEFMDSTGRQDKVSSILRTSAKAGTDKEGAMTKEALENLRNNLLRMNDTQKSAENNLLLKNKKLNDLLTGKEFDGKKLSDKQVSEILKAAKTKNFAQISDILQKNTLQGSKEGLTQAQFNSFMNEGGLKDAIMNAYNAQERIQNIKNIGESEAAAKVREDLEKFGITDLDIGSKKARAKAASIFSDRLIELEANPDEIYSPLENDNHDNLESLASHTGEILKLMIAMNKNSTDAIKEATQSAEAVLNRGQDDANTQYDKNKESAKESMGEDADNLTEEAEDLLSGQKSKWMKGLPSEIINNINGDSDIIRSAFKKSNIKKLTNYFKGDAISALSKSNSTIAKIIIDALNNKFIFQAIYYGGYKITEKSILWLQSRSNNKNLIEKCKFLSQICKKTNSYDIYNKWKSIEELDESLTSDAMSDLREEYKIGYHDSTGYATTDAAKIINKIGRGAGKVGVTAAKVGIGLGITTALAPSLLPPALLAGIPYLGYKGYKAVKDKTYNATHGIHKDKWRGLFKRKNNQQTESEEDTQTNEEQPVTNAETGEPVEQPEASQNALGTILGVGKSILGGIGSVVKGAGSLIGSLFKKKDKDDESNSRDESINKAGILSGLLNIGGNLFNLNKNGNESGNFDEVDKKDDGKDVTTLDGQLVKVERSSDGGVRYDTSDEDTKEALNRFSVKEKMTAKLQEAQLKAAELIKKNFDTSNIKESKGGKLGWLGLLLLGGYLWKSGILKKLFDGFIKPIWTENIKPWITDKVVPWITDKWDNHIKPFFTETIPNWFGNIWNDKLKPWLSDDVKPWVIDTVIPAIGTAVGGAVELLVAKLPSLIVTAVKGALGIGGSVLDEAITDNAYNTGGSTTINANERVNNYGADELTGMTDENGRQLTNADIANHNFNSIHNAQGIKGTVNEDGTVTFEDDSIAGTAYANKVIGAGVRSAAKAMATGRKSSLGKLASLASKGFVKTGKALSKIPLIGKPLGGLTKITGRIGQAVANPIGSMENIGLTLREKLEDKINKTAINMFKEAREEGMERASLNALRNNIANGDGSKVSEFIKKFADWSDNGIIGKAKDKISETAGKIFKKSTSEAAEGAAKKSMKDAAKKVASASGDKVKEVLATIISKAKKIIDGLCSHSTILSKLKDVAESLGSKGTGLIKGFKESLEKIITEAIEKSVNKVGLETCKAIASKVFSIAFIVMDFVTGAGQAESILGVSKTGLLEELVAGIVNAICGFFSILSIFPGTNWIVRKIYGFFNDDLEERQAEADAACKEYNDKHGTTYNTEEYLKRTKSVTGAVGGWVGDRAKDVTGAAISVGKGAVKGVKAVGKGIGKGFKAVGKGISWLGGKIFGNAEGTISLKDSPILDYISMINPISLIGKFGALSGSKIISKAVGKGSSWLGGKISDITSSFKGENKLSSLFTGVNDILGDVTEGFKFESLDRIINKARENKISIFSKDYWKDTDDKKDNTLKGVISKTYSSLTRIMNVPMLMVKGALDGLVTDIDTIGEILGNPNSSKSTSSSSSSEESSTSKTISTFSSKVKNLFSKAADKIKSFFEFGKGTGKCDYECGTGSYSKQIDPSIANIRFNTSADSEYQTIGNSGCGPAAAVNAIESMYGKGNSVADAANYALKRGYKETNGGTKPGFFSDYFNKHGYGSQTSYNKSDIEKNINKGLPTVIMGSDKRGTSSSTPFGKTPHYVTVTGTDGRGNAIVQDPESRYDNQLYPLKNLIKNTSLGVSAFGKNYKSKPSKKGFGRFGRGIWGRGKSTIVFIGDSRTVMMESAIGSTEAAKHIWSAKIGMGLYWMKTTGAPAVDSKIDGDKAVVILMGVNDVLNSGYYKQYATYINSKAKEWKERGADVYYASILPVSASGYHTIYGSTTNDIINSWNTNIKAELSSDVKYMDLNSQIGDKVVTTDDVHYNDESSKLIYDQILKNVAGEVSTTSDSTSTLGSTTTTSETTEEESEPSILDKFRSILMNSKVGMLEKLIGYSSISSSSSSSSKSSGSKDTGDGSATNKGEFPTYALNDSQIKGVANILQHEQPGLDGMLAEASLMANLTDKMGDENATVENLVKKATSGWFAYGSSRFYNHGNPSADAIKAAKAVMLNGKRTIPRYIDEHDWLNDLTSVTTNGVANNIHDRSSYVPHETKIKNKYGAAYTFYEFPNADADPFGYTSDELREKWGDDHYDPETAASGLGKNYKPKRDKNGLGKYGRGKYGRGTAEQVWWYLKEKMGMTDEGAAGMLGNIEAESGVQFNNVENLLEQRLGNKYNDETYTKAVDDGTITKEQFLHPMGGNTQYGYGLVQWTSPGRKEGLYELVKSRNTSISDPASQLDWLNTELNSDSYKHVLEVLKSTNDLQKASDIVLSDFERPSNWQSQTSSRAQKGKGYLDKLKGTKGEEVTGSEAVSVSNDGDDNGGSEDEDVMQTYLDRFVEIINNSKTGQVVNSILNSTGELSNKASIFNSAATASDVVRIAKEEVGTKETGVNNVKYNDWYWADDPIKDGDSRPWCAAFVSWVANQAKVPTSIIPKDALTTTAYEFLVNKGGKVDNNKDARAGDIAYFSKSGQPADIYHTGIVVENKNGVIRTVEGNSSDMVADRNYVTGMKELLIARPQYSKIGISKDEEKEEDTEESKEKTNDENILTEAPEVSNTRGGSNGIKPLSRYGQFRESIYGTGDRLLHKTRDKYIKVERSDADKRYGKLLKENPNAKPKSFKSGMGTINNTQINNSPDYSKLISSIISILMTIADNTDKLNLIVNILNDKLNLNISASEVKNGTKSNKTLKAKLTAALGDINASTSKFNTYVDNAENSSLNAIISAMNSIASE